MVTSSVLSITHSTLRLRLEHSPDNDPIENFAHSLTVPYDEGDPSRGFKRPSSKIEKKLRWKLQKVMDLVLLPEEALCPSFAIQLR